MKDCMISGEIEVTFKGTDDMVADILTKPLQRTKFKTHGICEVTRIEGVCWSF